MTNIITPVRVTDTSKRSVSKNSSIVHYCICNVKQTQLNCRKWTMTVMNYVEV